MVKTVALLNACTTAPAIINTGIDCNVSMGAPAMLIMMPNNAFWTAANEADFANYIETMSHAPAAQRWYCLFGQKAQIRDVQNGKESDVLETLPDGSTELVRKGMFQRTFMTTNGGICFAQALASFDKYYYSFIEVDKASQVFRMVNNDGTYSGFPSNLSYAPNPELADFTKGYKNSFYLSFAPQYYIGQGSIAKASGDLTSISGLINMDVSDAGTSSVTELHVYVHSDCGSTDLVALFPTQIAMAANFVVTDITVPGAVTTVVPSAVTVVPNNGTPYVKLVIAGTAAHKYNVAGATAATWLANNITGFEAIKSATIQL